ncbi:MAG TPA: RimK family alpha-L-glutamate ligase [Gemmatimonadaceae bacterium]|nr:RimK family alpha-L-glutamate ligase [Gemmatimonadaceae bacterium]
MKIPILSSRTGWHTDQLVRALRERGHEGLTLQYESLVARLGTRQGLGAEGEELMEAPAVLARIIPNGSLEQIIYRVDALHWLEDQGVMVMNSPRCIERSVDKFYTSAILQRAGLDTPETVVCERTDDAMDAFRAMGDVIVKPLFGSMGLGMVRVSDEDSAWRVFRALEAIRGVYYLQRAVRQGTGGGTGTGEEGEGRDVRAFVIGDRVVGAIERSAPGWRTNVARGGRARAFELPSEWCAMALRAARAVGAEYAGVDLLPADDGTVYLLEVNGIPGWRGLQQATSIDVAAAIVDHLLGTLAASG